MTRYVVDERRAELIATWGAGVGDVAVTVAAFPDALSAVQRLALAEQLTGLSSALWQRYANCVHTDGAIERPSGLPTDLERVLLAAVANPDSPASGGLMVSYDPVEAAAHRVGRCLHSIASVSLAGAVASDVASEIAAVADAERGDLSGRGRQATLLTHVTPSEAQIMAADRTFLDEPLSHDDLLLDFDPTAASVAAARWLWAAAVVASDASGIPVTSVVVTAHDIEPLSYRSPTAVLQLMELGLSAYEAVTSLVRQAISVARGEVEDVDALRVAIDDYELHVSEEGASDGDSRATVCLTPLDPGRPARGLLEDLLSAIDGCCSLYGEYVEVSHERRGKLGESETDAYYAAMDDQLRDVFRDKVRACVQVEPDRLL